MAGGDEGGAVEGAGGEGGGGFECGSFEGGGGGEVVDGDGEGDVRRGNFRGGLSLERKWQWRDWMHVL